MICLELRLDGVRFKESDSQSVIDGVRILRVLDAHGNHPEPERVLIAEAQVAIKLFVCVFDHLLIPQVVKVYFGD